MGEYGGDSHVWNAVENCGRGEGVCDWTPGLNMAPGMYSEDREGDTGRVIRLRQPSFGHLLSLALASLKSTYSKHCIAAVLSPQFCECKRD